MRLVKSILLAALDDALSRLERDGHPGAKDVHEARKRIKEMRAIVRLAANSKPIRDELRDAGRSLTENREADALIESFDKLRERFEWSDRKFGKIRRSLIARRDALPPTDPAVAIALLEKQRANFESIADDIDIEDGLLRSYRRSRRARRQAFTSGVAEDFHEWRKRVKEHWYQMKMIASPDADALHDLSRALGDHHDLATLRATIRDLSFDKFAARRMRELQDEANILGAPLFAEKPRAWLQRIQRRDRVGPKRAPERTTLRRANTAT